jgi:hypothetical protein
MLLAAIVLMFGLILLAQQSFVLGSFLASVTSSSPPSSSSAASTLNGIFLAAATALYVIAIAVLFVGPGNALMYGQKSRTGGEYAGDGLLVAGRIVLALAVVAAGAYLASVAGTIKGTSSGSLPNYSLPTLVASTEIIILYVVVGVVIGIVGRLLLHHPRELERQVPRDDKYERASRYLGWAATALYVLGVIVDILIVFEYFTGGLAFIPSSQTRANLFGYGIIFLGVGVILGGFRDMFHAWAFAEQPYPQPPAAVPTN